jgi:hypothetical protein
MILRYKVEVLEGVMQTMKREMRAVKTALGPWYRPEGPHTSYPPSEPLLPDHLSTARRFAIGADNIPHQSPNTSHDPFTPPTPLTNVDPDILAPYFPPETDPRPFDLRPTRHSLSQLGDTNPAHPHSHAYNSSRPVSQNPVAPINLSTTLEGSLSGLRESVVSLTASVDSLARRNDIALTNETLRLNEDVMSLRANVHGLRMQVRTV